MDIVEIRQKAERATPGPWTLRPAEWECDCGGDEDGYAHKTPDQCRDGWWRDAAWVDGPKLIEHGDGWTGFNDADADFMARAREDVPALCDALAAMTDELASMTVRMRIAEDGRQIETRRAERALDTLARYEQQQWMARAIGAEAAEERMLAERAPRRIEGTLPADDLRRAFADGAAWWNYSSTGFTMFGSERREAEAEAEARFPNGKLWLVEVQG
ncbi:MAG: hypothetical protein KAX65_03075 [Caldilineaceae bacterium]|nr:hypothetical protein [Caldilineaceae bacterium]